MKELSYHLLPGRCPSHFAGQELHDRVFLFWRQFWDEVLKDLDGSQAQPHEFDRQNLIGVIMNGNDIVSVHLYSHFATKSLAARSHPYFETSYEPAFQKWLSAQDDSSVMTMEYLTLNAAYRKSQLGISLAHVIVGLGTRIQRHLSADWSVAPCRQDVRVDEVARHFGAKGFETRIMHNVPVVSMILARSDIRTCPLLREASLIEKMWNERTDWTQTDKNQLVPATKEAA